MNDPLSEDERLAAFADGRLGERERAELLARLTTDDEAYEHFAGLAAILHEAEALEMADAVPAAHEDGSVALPGSHLPGATPAVAVSTDAGGAPEPDSDQGVIPLRPRKPAAALRWLALAAGIAGLALAGSVLWPRTSSAGEPVRLAGRLEHVEKGLPGGWNQPLPWSSPRGDVVPGDTSAQEKAVQAARAGTLLVDLSVAVRSKDAVRTQLLAEQITKRFDPQAGRNGALRKFRAGAGGSPERLEPLVDQATDRIAGRLGREALELGAWTEAARLAAYRHDSRFFRDRGTGPMLDRLAVAAADQPAHAAVEQVRVLVRADPPQWEELAAALRALSREIASE